jgi:hypothetical protein
MDILFIFIFTIIKLYVYYINSPSNNLLCISDLLTINLLSNCNINNSTLAILWLCVPLHKIGFELDTQTPPGYKTINLIFVTRTL